MKPKDSRILRRRKRKLARRLACLRAARKQARKQWAEGLKPGVWRPLARPAQRPAGPRRKRPENVKEQIVVAREYEKVRLPGEEVAEFAYPPAKCGRACRVIARRKNLSVAKGERRLFDEIRYFFYLERGAAALRHQPHRPDHGADGPLRQ